MSNLLLIAMSDAKEAVKSAVAKEPGLSLEDRLRAAFGATRHHWLVTDGDVQFRAGIGGVLTVTDDPSEKARIEAEVRKLNALQAVMSGVPVDFTAMSDDDETPPIGMLAIWREKP